MTQMNGHRDGPVSSEGAGIPEVVDILARLRAARDLPGLFAESFDAFEVVRLLARGMEDREPGLLAAFMTAADAAVDGREAITIAPSLPAGQSRMATHTLSVGTVSPGRAAEALAGLSALLGELLASAVAGTAVADDRAACREAAAAAMRISQLMARDGDDGHLR